MSLLFPRFQPRFQAKVLVPVILVMSTLVASTVWLVNRRIVRQLEIGAAERLDTAVAIFEDSRKILTDDLLLRDRTAANDPRFKAVSQLADAKTMRYLLNEFLDEYNADLVTFTGADGHRLAGTSRDRSMNLAELETNASASISHALEGRPNADVTFDGTGLFNVVSVPVKAGDNVVGALTFGTSIGDEVARQFRDLTHSEVAFLVHDQVVASTLPRQPLDAVLQLPGVGAGRGARKIEINQQHFVFRKGSFNRVPGPDGLGYVLSCSYEGPLQALRTTQHMLLAVGVGGIVVGSLIVWLIVRKITQPLRLLRDIAGAVGRGDFTQRVQVRAEDECGQLAGAFNQMTENLQVSRRQLEETVESLRNAKAQLTQSEKLSAVGEFVAGVTHELNNPLTTVIGFAELLERTSPTERQRTYMSRIASEAERCHKIVQSLLSFARQHPPERKQLKLNQTVEAAVEILAYHLRTSNIRLVMRLDSHLPLVLADPHQMQQVFVNVINNARQAIEADRPRGTIEIESRADAGKVQISIADDGPGISPDNLAKIFTPFFTTKEVGKGTGLGLSLCYGIVQEHGGAISVQSEPGRGTTFLIELPIAAEESVAMPMDASAVPAPGPGPSSVAGRRVLVVDDETAVCDLIREVLGADSLSVDTVNNGDVALRKVEQSSYDLILCDMKMPGLSGQQVYERLCTRDRATAERMVFMTGDVVGERTREFLDRTGRMCLTKPFSLDDFRATVGRVLEQSSAS